MKNLFTLLLIGLSLFCKAQTTITASYTTTTVTFSTGLTYVTFAVRNNNSFPVTITDMSCLQANLYEDNVYSLFYSVTSLSGPPTVASPTWTLLSTSTAPITVSVIGQVIPFKCIGLVIPASTTYRFALQGSKGTAVRGASSPNIFSSGGVDLLVGDNASTGGQVGYFGWQNIGNSGLPYFFDGSITFAQASAFTDVEIRKIIKPTTACSSTSNTLMAEVCNKSSHTLNFATNNTNVNFVVSGPISQTSNVPITSGSLPPCGCVNAVLGGVNFSSSGVYNISATASITGATDANLSNNTVIDSIQNYKPIVTPGLDSVCQFTSGALFPGFTGSNCQSRDRTFTLNTLITLPSLSEGSSDATAVQFAQSSLPGLPSGAIITGGRLFITNLNGQTNGTFGDEARFNIYSPTFGPGAPFVPGAAGSPLNFAVYNFDYSLPILASQLNSMYSVIGAGGTFSIGYWETFNDVIGASDIVLNAQSLTTQASLIIEYTIPPNTKWYLSPSTGSSFYTGSNMNPFTTSGSGLFNTNTVGTYTFYAACSADTACRVPAIIKVKASPAVVQDSLEACEVLSSTGNAVFDLTTVSGAVSAFNPLATVSFYQDINLSLLINTPTAYVSNTDYVFSRVEVAGCSSSDSIYLLVHPKPQFVSSLVSGAVCQPDYIDVANLIDPFSTVSSGTDTLYYSDPFYTIPHPNPHFITTSDTVYMLFETNTSPVCKDSSDAIITIFPSNNFIVSQDTFGNYSIPGPTGCFSMVLLDGISDTLHSTTDCSRIASVTDIPNGISLGNTTICEIVDPAVPTHNGQPYVNRSYQITPNTNDSAIVCLYFLDDDLVQYNNQAFGVWPLLPTAANPTFMSNLCITQTHNGDLNTPVHTANAIPNTSITATYDTATTVWTLCFPVDSFSFFYLHSQNPFNFPLSAQLISFSGKREQNANKLEWTTANEENNSHFILERSNDGKVFYPISSSIISKAVNGNSQVNLNYDFIDKQPLAGHNYYKLIQFDLDGKQSQSQIVDIFHAKNNAVKLYPNPIFNDLNIEIESEKNASTFIKIIDATGRVVRTTQLQLQIGTNKTTISLDELSAGIYQVLISNTQGLRYSETIRKN